MTTNPDQELPTDRGGHEPPAPPPSTTTDETVEHFVDLVRAAVHGEVSGLRSDLAAHQLAEMDQHRVVRDQLSVLVDYMREQGERLAQLETRVTRLEAARLERLQAADAESPDGP